MSQVILKSNDKESIKPLIFSALEAENKEHKTGILKTNEKLSIFEKKYNLSTEEFLKTPSSFHNINELEAIEWSGEFETLKRLEKELSRLIEIEICA